MSMIDGQGLQDAGTADFNDNGQGQGTGNEGLQPEAQQQQQQQVSNNPFLNAVDEADRAIVQKYIDKWDANVQRRMQEQARQFEPYKNLGDVEQLQRAVQLMEYFQRNPQEVYQRLHATFGQQQRQDPQQLQPQQFGGQGLQGYPEDVAPFFQQYDQRFGQFDQRFQQFEKQTTQILETLANHVLTQQRQAQEAQEDAALEQQLNLLKREFGDFDEEYVLTKMYTGMDGASAVQDWKNRFQQAVNQSRIPAPGPTLNGGGGTPPQGRRVEDLNKQETRALVASVLEQAAKAGG